MNLFLPSKSHFSSICGFRKISVWKVSFWRRTRRLVWWRFKLRWVEEANLFLCVRPSSCGCGVLFQSGSCARNLVESYTVFCAENAERCSSEVFLQPERVVRRQIYHKCACCVHHQTYQDWRDCRNSFSNTLFRQHRHNRSCGGLNQLSAKGEHFSSNKTLSFSTNPL